MLKFEKIQSLSVESVYRMCNEQMFFTCGSCRQYEYMFDKVRKLQGKKLTEARVYDIAFNIAMFSDEEGFANTEELALYIMSLLYSKYITTHYTSVVDK